MNAHPEDQRALRRYLLGESATPVEARRVEERLLADDLFAEEFGAAEDELIDDFVAGALAAGEREKFERHFLATDERRRRLVFARALHGYAGGRAARPARPARFAPYWKGAAAALVLLGLGLGVWLLLLRESELDRGLRLLAEAPRTGRVTEARVSGLPHAPLHVTRSAEPAEPDAARRRAELSLREALEASPGPAPRHALGRLYLDQGRVDDAVKQLEAALAEDPSNARLHGDLGAAYLERGRRAGGGLEDLARALQHLNRALELDGSLLEALFNRALTYEHMPLPARAEEAWREYLARDPSSPWADEARTRLRALEETRGRAARGAPPLSRFLDARASGQEDGAWEELRANRGLAGSPVVNELLDDYVAAALGGRDEEAHGRLAALSFAGRLEVERAGDHFTADLARAYASASRAQLTTLAEARRQLKDGHKLMHASDYEEAFRLYARAKSLFEEAGDAPEAVYAEYPMGHSLLASAGPAPSLDFFKRVARACERGRYAWLLAQSLGATGNAWLTLSDYAATLEHCGRALVLSESIGDAGGVAKMMLQIAQAHLLLGDARESLRLQQRGLGLTLRHAPADPMKLWQGYFTTALPLNSLGLYDAAIEFQREALRAAVEGNLPAAACRSRANLGLSHAARGDREEALRQARLALESAQALPGGTARADSVAYASLQLGHLHRRAGDPAAAFGHYDRAARFYDELTVGDEMRDYERQKFHAFSYAAHKGRLLACLAAGECPSAPAEIETTLGLFERHRALIAEERHRNVFFDAEQDICDVATDFDFTRRGDPRAAFDRAERCRARSLLAAHAPPPAAPREDEPREGEARGGVPPAPRPLGLDELQGRVPPGSQVIAYAVLEDKLFVWAFDGGRVVAAARAVGREELTARVERFLRLVSSPPAGGDDAEVRREAAALYELLIGPIAGALERGKQLCFVADKILNRLPFAALVAPDTGRYLVEDFILTRAPSASLFVLYSEVARLKGPARDEQLLSVGDPDFDRRAFPGLEALPAARREAAEVAKLYAGARRFVGRQAVKATVARGMLSSEVVHLALHAWVDERSPARSGLLLAAAGEGERAAGDDDAEPRGLLRASEIEALRLPRARLVVLSACRTGVERFYGGEGMVGLSRSFLAAGVPVVVASLWPVESDSTAELMVALHRRRKADRRPTAEALRLAALDLLERPDGRHRHPYYWAAFAAFGGHAEF